jgi:hypothetical protein
MLPHRARSCACLLFFLAGTFVVTGQTLRTPGGTGIPSAKEVAEQGISLGEMQAKLLAKIEELTLHISAQQKLIQGQAQRLEAVETDNRALHQQMQSISSHE